MAIVRGLITLAQMRTAIYADKVGTAPTTFDAEFELYISAATPYIEDGPEGVGPMFSESRTLRFDGGEYALMLPHRFNTVTSITVNGTAWTNYIADPSSGIIYSGSADSPAAFSSGRQNVVVIVTVGYATIPPHVQLATTELCRLWWQHGRQAGISTGPDQSALTPGILGRVRALLSPDSNLPGFA